MKSTAIKSMKILAHSPEILSPKEDEVFHTFESPKRDPYQIERSDMISPALDIDRTKAERASFKTSYTVTLQMGYEPHERYTPWAQKTSPVEVYSTKEGLIKIDKGVKQDEYVKRIYSVPMVSTITAQAGFLNRDNKQRDYVPGEADRFTFSSWADVKEALRIAPTHLVRLTYLWALLGLPLKFSDDKGLKLPDFEFLEEKLMIESADTYKGVKTYTQLYTKHGVLITRIISGVEITGKLTCQRRVGSGWFLGSYAGQMTSWPEQVDDALEVYNKAITFNKTSPLWWSYLRTTEMEQSDPTDSGVGAPFFAGVVNKEGVPVSRLAVIQMFEGITMDHNSLEELLSFISYRSAPTSWANYPLAVSQIRRFGPSAGSNIRSQPSYSGSEVQLLETGGPKLRIAWNVPWLFNLLIAAAYANAEADKKTLPGNDHSAAVRGQILNEMGKGTLFTMEGDYSDYDRTIQYKLIMSMYANSIPKSYPKRDLLLSLLEFGFKMYLIYPDFIPGASTLGRAIIVKSDPSGVLSGKKTTGSEGSGGNHIIVGAAALLSGRHTKASLYEYWTSRAKQSIEEHKGKGYVESQDDDPAVKPLAPTALKNEPLPNWMISSDDLLIMASSVSTLMKHLKAFREISKLMGLKAKTSLGSKFLMREMNNGVDLPIDERALLQNQLFPEDSVSDQIKMYASTAARTDGIAGHKTFNPSKVGTRISLPYPNVWLTACVIKDAISVMKKAAVVAEDTIQYLSLLQDACVAALRKVKPEGDLHPTLDTFTAKVKIHDAYAKRLDIARRNAMIRLVSVERYLMGTITPDYTDFPLKVTSSYIFDLYSNRHNPASQAILNQLLMSSPEAKDILKQFLGRDRAMFELAMEKLNLPLTLYPHKKK